MEPDVVNQYDPLGEMWCDNPQCDARHACHLREYGMGSRFCECGGRWQWTADPVDDDWEAW